MKYIDKLLQGAEVEWKKLGEVAEYEQPTPYLVKTTNYNNSYSTPVLTAGKTFILGYTNEHFGIYEASKNPVIIFDDFTTANKWVDFDFKVKSSAMKMITSIDESKYLLRYIYFWINTLPSELAEGDHKRQWISNYANKIIPIPPLSVQRKLVEILDKFTELEAELEAELDCRKRQYEYYRNKLLAFDMLNTPPEKLNNVTVIPLEKLCSVLRGKRLTKKELYDKGDYPVFHGGIDPIGYYSKPNREAHSTMIINVGASAGTVGYSSREFWSSDGCFCFSHNESLNQRYLYYVLQCMEGSIKAKVRKAGIPTLDNKVIAKIKIPIPPLSEQQRIVSILDKFDTLTSSISEGLPKEIELRRKQYEYYREQLLSFRH